MKRPRAKRANEKRYGYFIIRELPPPEYRALERARRHFNTDQRQLICAAIRLLCQHLDEVPDTLALIATQAPADTPDLLAHI